MAYDCHWEEGHKKLTAHLKMRISWKQRIRTIDPLSTLTGFLSFADRAWETWKGRESSIKPQMARKIARY
jgi:hypothetical protein